MARKPGTSKKGENHSVRFNKELFDSIKKGYEVTTAQQVLNILERVYAASQSTTHELLKAAIAPLPVKVVRSAAWKHDKEHKVSEHKPASIQSNVKVFIDEAPKFKPKAQTAERKPFMSDAQKKRLGL